jgi:sec-independent protein translocase protein TatA
MLGIGISNFIAGQEWIFIIIIAVVFIFGAKKIPELAKTLGKAKGEFEKGKIEGEKELKDFKDNESKSD